MFICNHCPYVVHVREALAGLVRGYQERGVAVVAINANDVERYPDDGPERMREVAKAHGFSFPYLYDATQAVAKTYKAACTPDFFLYDGVHRLAYRGQLDRARPGNDEPMPKTRAKAKPEPKAKLAPNRHRAPKLRQDPKRRAAARSSR